MNIIEKIKMYVTNNESYDGKIIAEEYKNKLSYEEYILRSRISVFKFRKDL